MPRTKFLLAGLVVLVAVALTYSNHFYNAFQFDDSHTIRDNVYVRSLTNFPQFFSDARTSSVNLMNQSWRPLVTASLALDYRLGHGYEPFYFHLSTFLWFLTMIVLLALLFETVLDKTRPDPANFWIAWFAAAWFGLHPAIAETVNYIIQRADVMSTWGVVAGIVFYVRFPASRRWGWYLLPVAVGLLAKAPGLIFPLILAAYLGLFEEKRWTSAFRRAVPAFGLSIAFLILQSVMTPKTFTPGSVSGYRYLITQPYVWFRYFVSFFLPVHLSADTDLTPLESIFSVEALGGMLFVAVLLVAIYLSSKRPDGRPIAFGLTWFVLGLIPTSVFPLAEVENDHRMFLPFVGLVLAVTWAGSLVARNYWENRALRVAIPVGAVCLLLLCAAGTRQRNDVWHTEESLWQDVTIKSPKNGRGLMNYGLAKMGHGDYRTALTYFERAAEYTPNYVNLEINLGIDYASLGRDAEAEQHFRRALQLAPGQADSRYFYARWLRGKARNDEAADELRTAILVNPARIDARLLLAEIYTDQNAWELLKPLAAETLKLAPDDPAAQRLAAMDPARAQTASTTALPPEALLNVSLQAYQKKDYDACIKFAELALKARPQFPEAYNNIMAAYNSLGRWDEAIQAGREALRLNPNYQLARNNLKWAESQKTQRADR